MNSIPEWQEVLKYDWTKSPSNQPSFGEQLDSFGDKYIAFWKKLYMKLANSTLTPSKIRTMALIGAIEIPKLWEYSKQRRASALGKELQSMIGQARRKK